MRVPYIILCAVIVSAVMSLRSPIVESFLAKETAEVQRVGLSRAIEMIRQGEVAGAVVAGGRVEMTSSSGSRFVTEKESQSSFIQTLQAYGLPADQIAALPIEIRPTSPLPQLLPLLAGTFAAALLVVLLGRRRRWSWAVGTSEGDRFRRSRARVREAGQVQVTFDDVAGAEEVKQELREVVDFLRSPERFTLLGARAPHGLLLTGAPGTGKTLLARAVAGEAGVPFLSCSGSEFVEVYVGVGAARIRDLFEKAKKSGRCIVFIDEIDAIGRRRNQGAANEEREQALNQILVEMDGFEKSANVVVMAATNRPDVLDPALLRPGRFDRRIVVDTPDVKDRLAILGVHSLGKRLSPEVDLEQVARQTTGFSGADLENVMNEGALLAGRRGAEGIAMVDLEEAIDRGTMGLARRSRAMGEREKWIIGYHEAGHALVAHSLPNVDPVRRISIISRGTSGGHTRLAPLEDRRLWSKGQLGDMLAFALGGMAAEQLTFGETTTASARDLAEATSIARKMVSLFGMSSEFGLLVLEGDPEGGPGRGASERMASAADLEAGRLLTEAQARAVAILERERERLVAVAVCLFQRETLQGQELADMLGRGPEDRERGAGAEPAPEVARYQAERLRGVRLG